MSTSEVKLSLMSEIAEAAVAERDEVRAQCERLAAQNLAMRMAITHLWAAIGDRLLAKGPLSQSYARSVLDDISDTLDTPVEPLVARFKAADALIQIILAYEAKLEAQQGETTPEEDVEMADRANKALAAYIATLEATK